MISVIIPLYNRETTIIRALESVRKQTAFNEILEIIVVDDGSTDNSNKVVQVYKKLHPEMPIKVVNKENSGVSSARNTGMKLAKGKWIALLDSDDEWLSDKIKIQIQVLNDHPNIDFLGCSAIDKELRILWRKINRLYKANIRDLCIKCFPNTPTVIFKRKIIDEIGMFDESQKYGEDMNFFNKICINYNYYYLPIKLVELHRGETQSQHNGLSSNLRGMHIGNIKNIQELRERHEISVSFYFFLRFFYLLKYIRRIILKKFG